jgi:uncharacterized membrane protein
MAVAAGTSTANRRPPYGDRAVTETHSHRLHRLVVPPKLPEPISPAQIQHAEQRAADAQNRAADAITRFSGSMTFVYLHVIWFGAWIGFGVEKYPYGLLTMIVSLEAIFLSTFVMISQNRADATRQVAANQEWQMVQEEDHQNRRLLDLSQQILELTQAVHAYASAASATDGTLQKGPSDETTRPVAAPPDGRRARDPRKAPPRA